MYSEEKLYEFIEDLIDNSTLTDALYQANSDRRLHYDVSGQSKTVRCECWDGVRFPHTDEKEREFDVSFAVEFVVLPESDAIADIKQAVDLSYQMFAQFNDALCNNRDLNGTVCKSHLDDGFEKSEERIGGVVYGRTTAFGKIN